MDVFPYLKASPLLRGFTDDWVKIIQSAVAPRQLEPGMPVFVERMMGESAFLLCHGEVSIFVTRHNAEREIGVLHAPDSFGELSLLQPGPRRATVKARTPLLLVEIPRREFLRVQQQRPQACLKLIMNITETFALKSIAAAPLIDRLVDVAN